MPNPPHSSPFPGNSSFGASKGGSKSERRSKSGGGGSGTPSSSRPRKSHDRGHDRAAQQAGAVNYEDDYHAHATGQRAMESRAFLQPTTFGEFDEEDAFASGQFMDDGDGFANSALLRNSHLASSGGPQPNAFWKVSYSRAVAASRFYRNQALIAEVLNETCVPDVRSVVTTQRLHVLRKQVASLEAHQLKLEAELSQLTEKHDVKKRRIVESFSSLRSDYSRACGDRQRFAVLCDPKSETFRALVERYKSEYSKAVSVDASSTPAAQGNDTSNSPNQDKKDTAATAAANDAASTNSTEEQSSRPPAADGESTTPTASNVNDDAKPTAEALSSKTDTTRNEESTASATNEQQQQQPTASAMETDAPQSSDNAPTANTDA